ncbi:MAG: AzlD domain-containing protein [Boseongicola sp. SB0676_bin_33]|nr:AzlD domain-containing protein [Boseongicola sp. SB0676_bin_33]MYK30312.1 AzlD domain-containing protein [Boseongicola sp. SB0670_bin_30]
MSHSATEIWAIIAVLGAGTFLIRFSFLGPVAGRRMPDWLLRHLRYTPVAVLPGLVAPLVAWPDAAGGVTDPVRLAAALATLVVAFWRKSVLWGALAGATTLEVLNLMF